MDIKITKQLATLEDLAVGSGSVVQERNGVPLTLTKIDLLTNAILASDTGASRVGTSDGFTVQEELTALKNAAPGSSDPDYTLVIGVIGDSLSVANTLQETSWPQLFQDYINQSGGDIRVVNYSQNSQTFKKANEDAEFGTETAREALISAAPDIILCALGVVDVDANELNRSITDLKADAAAFYSAISAALPTATVIQLRNHCFDTSSNATSTALKNKDVLPYFMQRRTSGILAGAYCSEILSDDISIDQQTRFNQTTDFYDYISNLSQVNFVFDINYWKIARAGLLGSDSLNPATYGKVLMCGYVAKALIDNTISTDWGRLGGDKNYPTWYNPDLVLDSVMDPNDNWTYISGDLGPHHAVNLTSLYKDIAPNVWYLPNKTSVSIEKRTITTGQPFTLAVYNGPSNLALFPSIDGGAFDLNDPSLQLTSSGSGVVSLTDAVPPGTYVFRYRCGSEVYGPYTFVFEGGGTTSGTLAVVDGGTGANNAAGARANLNVYSTDEVDILTDGAPLFKIAVIGDSLSTENALAEHAWPSLMQKYINNSGGYCRVVNYARNSFTFAEASTDINAFDGRTALQAVIDEKPNVVICAFGVVDVIANEAGKSLSTLQAEAASFYSALKAGLPNAKLCHAEQTAYDKVNATSTALKNKDVLPYFMQRRTSGILADSYCSEMLTDNISSSIQTNMNNGVSFYSYIENLADVDHMFEIDYWKIARVGLLGPDGLHPASFGKVLQCGYVINQLVAQFVDPFFAKLRVKNYETWYNADALLDGIINKNDNWSFQYFPTAGQDHAVNLNSLYKDVAPTSWYLPYKTSVSIPRTTYEAGQPFLISFNNGPPLQDVIPSVDGGAFDAGDPSLTLTVVGNGSVAIIDPIAPGTYTFRYKCGVEVYGPYTFVFNAGSSSSGTLAVADGGTGATTAIGARTNLDVHSKAESDNIYLNESDNLSDLPNKATARTNLQVYSEAQVDSLISGVSGGITQATADARYLNESSNLSDLASASTARSNLGVNQTGPNSVSYNTGWTTGDTLNYRTPRYYKDHNGRVHLEGCVKRTSGTGPNPFTLPVGYRPSKSLGFVVPLSGSPVVILVEFDGDIDASEYTTNGELLFLDGISFMAT